MENIDSARSTPKVRRLRCLEHIAEIDAKPTHRETREETVKFGAGSDKNMLHEAVRKRAEQSASRARAEWMNCGS